MIEPNKGNNPMKLFLITTAFSVGSALAMVTNLSMQAPAIIQEAHQQRMTQYCAAGLEEACELLAAKR